MRNVIRAYNEALFETNKGTPFETNGSYRDIPRGLCGGITSCRAVTGYA